jgi:hypothetical protein
MNSVTQAAADAIGGAEPRDWQLRPETHAAALQPPAAALRRILVRPEFEQMMEAYTAADDEALLAQKRYKRLAGTASLTSFLAVFIAGLLLLQPAGAGVSPRVLSGLAGLQFVLIVTSFLASLILGYRKPFAAWMRRRAEAENARISLFKRVTAAEEEVQPGELPLLPLQLEYFRRYQLDVQRLYYGQRGRQHARSFRRAAWWRIAALVLVVAAAGPLVWSLLGQDWVPARLHHLLELMPPNTETAQRLFLCVGVIGGALQGLLASFAVMSHDERNAARYLDTSRNLDDLATRPLDEARDAAVLGDRERVLGFVALVHEQVSSEHREWIALRSVAPDLSLDRLRATALPKLS